MNAQNAITKITSLGLIIEKDILDGWYVVRGKQDILSWHVNDSGTVDIIKVQAKNDIDIIEADYHGGRYYDSIDKALKSFDK